MCSERQKIKQFVERQQVELKSIPKEKDFSETHVHVCVTFVPKFKLINHQINHNGSLTDNIFKKKNSNK